MNVLCLQNLTVIGMKCPNCGMYIKAYLTPDDYTMLLNSENTDAVKFVANFECTQCHKTWSITLKRPQ
jgi:hypothetical protein